MLVGRVPSTGISRRISTIGRHFDDRAFSVSCDVQVAIDVAPHAVKSMVLELSDQTFVRSVQLLLRDRERPHVSLF